MEKVNTRKVLLVGIFVLILLVIALLAGKFTYSFLTPNLDEDLTKSGEVTASGDTLIFMKGDSISLKPTSDNFGTGNGDLTATTNPSVKLVASSKTNNASAKYYVGVNITNNTYRYSTEAKTPELILQIRDENGALVKTTSDNTLVFNETIQGFDITEKSGLFNIAEEHLISTTSSTTGETHTWTFTITFKNLGIDVDQGINESANLSFNAILQKEKPQIKYWNDGFSYSAEYAYPNTPSTTYGSVEELQAGYADFATYPFYIKTTTTEHQACLYYNNKEFCLGPNYWDTDGSTTKAKLKADMEAALGVTMDSCSSSSYSARCDVSGFDCFASSYGYVSCIDDSHECVVLGGGGAYCG